MRTEAEILADLKKKCDERDRWRARKNHAYGVIEDARNAIERRENEMAELQNELSELRRSQTEAGNE